MVFTSGGPGTGDAVLAGSGVRAPADVFNDIFVVFLVLGTLVGVVVIAYTLYNAYKYRYREEKDPAPEADRPELGELPEGGGKGKKLFLSFTLSAIIVISLVVWTYASLLYVEDGAAQAVEETNSEEALDVHVEGFRFGWEFTYPNGHSTSELRVPRDRVVNLSVTSLDVFHNFGVPELRIKSDAIPGQTTTAWFVAEETGTYTANCYELCGSGHSYMTADVVVMSPSAYQEWYAGTSGPNGTDDGTNGTDDGTNATDSNGTEMNAVGPATNDGPATVGGPTTNDLDAAAGAPAARVALQP